MSSGATPNPRQPGDDLERVEQPPPRDRPRNTVDPAASERTQPLGRSDGGDARSARPWNGPSWPGQDRPARPPAEAATVPLSTEATRTQAPPRPVRRPPTEEQPAPRPVRRRAAGVPVRRSRVVRKLDPWSVLKLSLVFYFCALLVVMLALSVFWAVVNRIGLVDRLLDFLADLQLIVTIDGGMIARAVFLVGLLNVILWSGVNVFLAFLYNLIADLVGGLRVTVVEED